MYPVVEVPADAADSTEQLGTKPKFWFRDGAGRRCLFKQGRPGTGENWAEKVSAELCELLDIPHAHYDLAVWRDQAGVVSPTFVPEGSRLVLGNEVLGRWVQGYEQTRYYQQPGHTIGRVFAVLRDPAIKSPASSRSEAVMESAGHVFVGYLMLDALIGNTDRHHENWGLIVGLTDQISEIRLAPSFDHASSLGRNESEPRMLKRIETRDPAFAVAGYAKRARSALYRSPRETRPLSTLDAFDEARRLVPGAAAAWIARLRNLVPDDIRTIVDRVPDDFMTAIARDFAMQIITENTARLFRLAERG